MKKIIREQCVLSGQKDFETLYTFKNFPVFMGCTDKPINKDIKSNMEWIYFEKSGMIQLKQPLPLEVVYSEFHNSGCIGNIWSQHHKEFAKFISNSEPKNILEIGGGHGILSLNYKSLSNAKWTIIEPNPNPSKDVTADYIKGFFNKEFTSLIEFDTIVHSHVFEHLYEPKIFIENISRFLKQGQKLIFSIPNMNEMMNRKHNNFLNFEHTYFLSEEYTDYFLTNNNFRIINKKHFKKDHSIFYEAIKDNSVKKASISNTYAKNNKTLFLKYINHNIKLVNELNNIIANEKNPIFLFGAHIFAQYLISMGLNTSKTICILDNDIKKQKKRLYGTSLNVKSPKILANYENPIVILRAGVYDEEIRTDILENINSQVKFI